MKRQKTRKALLFLSLLLFPVTIYYFSPYLIITGALEGIINGSFIVFAAMLIGSIFFGRIFCGYICPAGGLQECAFCVNDKAPGQGWKNNIKYVIWIFWIAAIIVSYVNRNHTISIDFFYQTEYGISVSNIYAYIVYYGVIFIMLVPSFIAGKRTACHYICWMAPFMVIGTKIRKMLKLPGLHIEPDTSKCVSCKQCNKKCPMSLDVEGMVQKGKCDDPECILCGECVDVCAKKVLKYKM